MSAVEKLQAIASENRSREVNLFDVPEDVPGSYKGARVAAVGLVALKAREEFEAQKRAGNDSFKLAYELAKQSLWEVNGARVSLADGSLEEAWDEFGPQVRALVINGYAEIHAPREGATLSFLKSRKRQVK